MNLTEKWRRKKKIGQDAGAEGIYIDSSVIKTEMNEKKKRERQREREREKEIEKDTTAL